MAASNAQVQQFVNERVRPRAEQMRALFANIDDDINSIDDVFANLAGAPDWEDTRSDAPPTLLTPGDVLAWNAFIQGLKKFKSGTFADVTEANSFAANWATVQSACVRPLGAN